MYIPACVFLYSNCVYVCVRGRGRTSGEERRGEEEAERGKKNTMIE